MKLFKKAIKKKTSDKKLEIMDSESEYLTSSLTHGVAGIGEMLSALDTESVSRGAINGVGEMLVIVGGMIEYSADSRQKINARKLERIRAAN